MDLSTKYIHPYPQNHPETLFWGPFNAKPIIQIALRKSHVNRATKVKLYSYIGIRKHLGVLQNFSTSGRPEGAGPISVNLGPTIISETT